MHKSKNIYHSILIVSTSDRFNATVKKSLKDFITIDIVKNVAMSRRCILEKYYDLVVVNMPLSDETGEDFALDVVENSSASVLVVTPKELYGDVLERLTDYGIMVLTSTSQLDYIDKAIRFLTAYQNKIHKLQQNVINVKEKMEELRIVSKAKLLLVEKKHMTEDDAHRLIGKRAMDKGLSRRRIAERIIDDLE
ncbi:MAG: ANTAR domain-containing protein [Lachnospiraceae bacterium]|nr:ANTAR domain-containing protein [Lachnospiraceae bacterium]